MSIGLGFAQISKELAGVIISVINADSASINTNIEADAEIARHEWGHTVRLEDHMSIEECTHGHASVRLFGLNDQNTLVLQEVVNNQVVNTMVLNTILNNGFFKVTVEAKYLLVKLDVGWLELLVQVCSLMVGILLLRE